MVLSTVLSTLALLLAAEAQLFGSPPRPPGAFENIQPVDTVVLTQYNASEAVYPSRKSSVLLP